MAINVDDGAFVDTRKCADVAQASDADASEPEVLYQRCGADGVEETDIRWIGAVIGNGQAVDGMAEPVEVASEVAQWCSPEGREVCADDVVASQGAAKRGEPGVAGDDRVVGGSAVAAILGGEGRASSQIDRGLD